MNFDDEGEKPKHIESFQYSAEAAKGYAIDLLLALDSSQKNYTPRTHEWIVNTLHKLVSELDERQGGIA